MSQTFKLSILAPERKLLQNQDVKSLIVTTGMGEVEILPGHAPLVATLETGRFQVIDSSGKALEGVISSGFLNVSFEQVSVTAETIELKGEVDLSRAKRAQDKAEQMLKDASLDEASFKKYQLKLQRAMIRQTLG